MDISIVIPNYNTGNLLANTLASIFNAPCKYELEVLIMDNLSSDNPLAILRQFPAEHIHFHSESDSGIYDAMNKGIRQAKGNWLIFLGAGDELIMDSVNQLPFDSLIYRMIYGDVYLVQSSQVYDGPFDFKKMTDKNISHQAIFYHSSLFQKLGLFDLRYRITADYVFNLALFGTMGHSITYVPLVISRFLGGGISDSLRDNAFHDHKFKIINKTVLKRPSLSGLCHLMRYNMSHSRKFLRARLGLNRQEGLSRKKGQ